MTIYAEMRGQVCRVPAIESDKPLLPMVPCDDVWFLDLTGRPAPLAGQLWNGTGWAESPAPVDYGVWKDEFDFYELFGIFTHASIVEAAKTDSMIQAFMDRVRAKRGAHLLHPATQAGLAYLVAYRADENATQGLLTQEQMTKISAGVAL